MCFYPLVVFEYNEQKHFINAFYILSIVILGVLCATLLTIGGWKQKLATLRQPTYLTHYPQPQFMRPTALRWILRQHPVTVAHLPALR